MTVGRLDKFKTLTTSDNFIFMRKKLFCNYNDVCVLLEIMLFKKYILRAMYKKILIFEKEVFNDESK